MWSISKKELSQFFSGVTGYLTIILFLLVCGLFLFVFQNTNIFDAGYATLTNFFSLAPWVLVFLVPAVAMRTISDEYKSGTFELLRTHPLTPWQIALGKYFSTLIVLVLAILPTILYVITIRALSTSGNIDSGGIAGSYIGLFFLAAAFAAICVCCSSFTNNSVVAFLTGAFACLVLYYGFNAISLLPVFKGNADYYIEMLGIDFHYNSISRGVIDTRDIVYFLSIIFLFLFITQKNISRHR